MNQLVNPNNKRQREHKTYSTGIINKAKAVIIILLVCVSLNIYATNKNEILPPIKVVYNYRQVINTQDPNLHMEIKRNDSICTVEIKYNETKFRCDLPLEYFYNSDSVLILLNSYNKKENKVFVGSSLKLIHKHVLFCTLRDVRFLPFHEIIFYSKKEFKDYYWDKSKRKKRSCFGRFFSRLLETCVFEINYRYMTKHFGDGFDENKEIDRYFSKDIW